MSKQMNFKQISFDLKDLDETKGVIKAYANAYNNEDSDKDISAMGSFTKTVKENYKPASPGESAPRVSLGKHKGD